MTPTLDQPPEAGLAGRVAHRSGAALDRGLVDEIASGSDRQNEVARPTCG
jgi:hypothetical protein